MHEGNLDIKNSELEDAQIEIIEQIRSPDLQESNERANNKTDVVLKNIKV